METSQNLIKTNKLVINLIKEGITDSSLLYDSTNTDIGIVEMDGVGTFIYTKSRTRPPDWLTKFFPSTPMIDPNNFKVASSQALLILEIEHSGGNRFMTVAFGSGRFLLADGMIEERFGLRTTLNLIDPDEIRRIDKKNLSSNPKLSREQIGKATGVAGYDFNFESDIVQALTGGSIDSSFGKTVSGRDSLLVSVKVDKTNIKTYLATCLETYYKTTYTTNFAWIDQIKEVRDNTVIIPLLSELLLAISSGSDKVIISIPEIIEWDSFGGFKYSIGKREELKQDLEMVDMLEEIKFDEAPTIETLKKHYVTMWNTDNTAIEKKWSVFACLTAEIELNGKTYILTESKWFEVDQDYMASIETAFANVPSSALSYIPYTHRTELEYNTAFAPTIAGGCLDQKTIVHGAGKSKIEFCDVMTDQKQFIHVKKYTGSATLSHLFKQGMVASELVLKDPEFRKKVRKRLQNIPLLSAFQPMVPLARPKPNEYSIIFAIAQKGTGPLSLPLFSKIALRSTVDRLQGYDFKVFLDKIPM